MDEEGNNVLHIAAANGYDLPSSSFNTDDINCQNYFGWTPLMYSAYHGHDFLVKKFLSLGADVRMKNDFGASVITLAAASGKVGIIRSGIKEDKITSEFDFTSPLAIAIALGHLSVTKYLIDHGFDPNSTVPSSGVTPLMLAVCQNNIEVVKLLIERDVCISSVNVAGYSALDLAMLKGNKEIMSILHQKAGKYLDINPDSPFSSDEEMSLAAKSGNLLSLRNQLSKNFLTDTFYQTNTQYFNKISKSNDKKCSLLPENPGYSEGKIRKLKCINNSNFERLNEMSMQINIAEVSGEKSENTSSCKNIDKSSKIKGEYAIENEKVNNALVAACLGGHMEAVYLLLAAGANPNYEQKGRTPLMIAVEGSQLEIAKLLLSVGADPQVLSTKDYLTAFDLATLAGASTELIRILASCTLQPSVLDAKEVCQLQNSSEADHVSSPFDKIKRFKFVKSPKGSSHLKSNKVLWNQLNVKESRKVLSPYRCKLLGSSNSKGSSNIWGQLMNNDKQNIKTQSDYRMRSRRPLLSDVDISRLPFPSNTLFSQLPSDNALSMRVPLFIPHREVNRVVQKKSFNEMEDILNQEAIKTSDIPVKILNLI